ncbi:hypothetical protein FPOAC1_010596 [Fusarium poae]|uniref:hypothetical protein n=1 Tax=Fusarium poae TaxID=36050 RepID=UPI001CEB6E86|nr:hypothetical protein FPOAC1_010596 [Fusarium poae]KAG8665795.1 hypothetical protein FPOAC1_010596 [Fusarium poae]
MAGLLLRWGADVNASPGRDGGKTCLEAAAGVGNIDFVKFLLGKGASCSNPDSLLKEGFRSGSTELVKLLLDLFSNAGESVVDIADNWSEYLEITAKSGNLELLNMILKLSVDSGTDIYEKHVIDAMEAAAGRSDSRMLCSLLIPNINPNADGRACRILSKAIRAPIREEGFSCFALLMAKFTALWLDLNEPLPGDPTPLCTAICLGKWVAAQCLILCGADVEKPSLCYVGPDDQMRNDTIQSPIVQAIRKQGHDDGVCLVSLLITNGANVNSFVDEHKSALLLALKLKRYEIAEVLLEHGANPNAEDSETGKNAFDFIADKHIWPPFSTFKSLIDHGFQPNRVSGADILNQIVALAFRNVSDTHKWKTVTPVASLLLNASARVNTRPTEKYPMTALQYAVDANHKELVTVLLAAGADIYAPAFWKRGKTVLQAASYSGSLEQVRSLVAQGLDINAKPASHYGATALQFAAMQGHLEVAIFLLENGALINAPAAPFQGRTTLQGAAEHGRLDMIYLLLENDQDDGLEERCQDAAKFAETQSRFEIAQLLREYKKL